MRTLIPQANRLACALGRAMAAVFAALLSLGLGLAEAPRTPPSFAALDIPYSADNPPGPSFSEDEKQRQFAAGTRIVSEIRAAFAAGREAYVIPPGEYRFDSVRLDTGPRSFALQGMQGDPAKPFRIIGYGATFWFGLSEHPAPHYHQMVKVFDCSHLSLEGITIDSDPRGSMDARITAFDFEGNRVQVRPVAGTRLLERMPAAEGRCIPFKADGRHVAALYQVDEGWGPGNLFYVKMERTSDGLYWFTFKNRKLLEAIRSGAWQSAYGSSGTLEVGDMLGFVYSTSAAITLDRCRRITVKDCRFFAAKAGLDEADGYGDHHWINCHFMARPGTNNLLGGDGVMSACPHGSTFERWVVQRTTDDAFNNHGHWKYAVAAGEHSLTFKEGVPALLTPGQLAEAYDAPSDRYLGRLTVESAQGKTVVFREPVGGRFAKASVMFPAFQNAGWVIRDSLFVDSYQRVLLGCGPGLFEGNRLERVGAGLTLGNGRPIDIEGGDPHGVVIRGNVFVDSGCAPALRAIRVRGTGQPIRGLEISGNLFVGTGAGAVSVDNAAGAVIRDNVAVRPTMGSGLLPKAKVTSVFFLRNGQGGEISGNLVVASRTGAEPAGAESSADVRLERNLRAEAAGDLSALVARRLAQHEVPARVILSEVREQLGQSTSR